MNKNENCNNEEKRLECYKIDISHPPSLGALCFFDTKDGKKDKI